MKTNFFRKPETIAFLLFTAVYALAIAFIFGGTWSLDRAPVEPDNPIIYPINDASKWVASVLAGGRFIPSDLMHVIGGMYFWQELQYALGAYLAALGVAYYLSGRGLGLVASFGGGAAYGLMGYNFTLYSAGHLGWFVWLMYGPFAFGLVDRAIRNCRLIHWALLGAVLAWSAAQQPDMWLLFTVLTAAYGVWCLCRERKNLKPAKIAIGIAITAVTALAVGMPQFSKALFEDMAGREKQINGNKMENDGKSDDDRWNFCVSWSLPPEDTMEFAIADVHGGSNDPRVSPNNPYKGRLGQRFVVPAGKSGRDPVSGKTINPGDVIWIPYRQHSLYFGLIGLLFAIAGIFGRFIRPKTTDSTAGDFKDVPFWIVVAAIVYLCALGGFTPFYRLVYALPFGSSIRCPVKFVHLLEFATAVLAGYGIASVKCRLANAKWIIPVLAALCALNVADLARVDARYLAIEDVSFQRAANEAAEDVVKAGSGKVFVDVAEREGRRLYNETMSMHLAETADSESAAQFIFVTGSTMRAKPEYNQRINEGKLKPVGVYSVSKNGILRASKSSAGAVLLQIVGKNTPEKTPEPPPNRIKQMLTLLSVLATVTVSSLGIWKAAGK